MSSISMELGGMSIKITPSPDRRKRYPGGTKSLKLYFQISNESHRKHIHHSVDGGQQQFPRIWKTGPKSAYLWMDAAAFGRQTAEELSRRFAPELDKVGIESSQRIAEVASKVSEQVKGMMRSVQKRRKVMVINVEIESEVIYRVFESDLERAIWESRSELENGNHGMVAADLDAAKKMMKTVRVGEKGEVGEGRGKRRRLIEEEERECIICFEKVKEIGIGLPCQHLFHSDCIIQWLQTSHYCPLCRFQMPTSLY